MVNSRDKGKRGELNFIHSLQDIWPKAKRNWMEQSAIGGVDILNTSPFDFEVKVGKQCNMAKIKSWLDQVNREGDKTNLKAVLCKPDREDSYVIMSYQDFMEIVDRYMA